MFLTKDRNFYKTLFLLAVPIALQNLLTFSVGLCDNIMIGRLGDSAVSGVYMGNQMQMLLQFFSGGIEGAILVISAQYWGHKDTEKIRKITSVALRFSLIIGLLLTLVCIFAPKFVIGLFTNKTEAIDTGANYLRIAAFSYVPFCLTQALVASMRSVEAPKVGLYVSFASLLINLTLNYLLIFGNFGFPALGVRGAAISTVAARFAEFLIICAYVFFKDKKLEMKAKDILSFDKKILFDFFRYGTPIILGQLVWSVNILSSAAIMGRMNSEGIVTALSIANALNNLAYVVMNGFAGAVGIITGKTVGEGKEKLMREYAKTVQILFLGLGILTGGLLLILRIPFISIYNVTDAALKEASRLILVLSVTAVGTCYQVACLSGLVKSGGDTSFVFKNDALFVFLWVIPSALVALRLGAPPWVVFAALKSDHILKCIVAAIKINRFNWMKNLTRDKTNA